MNILIENLIPRGFLLAGEVVVKKEKGKEVEYYSIFIITKENYDEAMKKVREAAATGQATDEGLAKIRRNAVKPIIKAEYHVPSIYSPAQEQAFYDQCKVAFISQFIGLQLTELVDFKNEQDGLQSVSSSGSEEGEKEEGNVRPINSK